MSDKEIKRERRTKREKTNRMETLARRGVILIRFDGIIRPSIAHARDHFSCPLSLMNLFYVCNLWVSAREEKCLTMPREDGLFRSALTLVRINRAIVLPPVSYFRPFARSTRRKERDRQRERERERVYVQFNTDNITRPARGREGLLFSPGAARLLAGRGAPSVREISYTFEAPPAGELPPNRSPK